MTDFPPEAVEDEMYVHHGQAVTVDVLANDIVADGFPELEVTLGGIRNSR